MKVTVQINQGQVIELPHPVVQLLIGFLDEDAESPKFFEELSLHPSSTIRAEVANKLQLSAATYERLAYDPSIDVVKSVIGNSSALAVLAADTFKAMIRRDVSVALELLSWGLEEMPSALRAEVWGEILKYDDSAILDAVKNEK